GPEFGCPPRRAGESSRFSFCRSGRTGALGRTKSRAWTRQRPVWEALMGTDDELYLLIGISSHSFSTVHGRPSSGRRRGGGSVPGSSVADLLDPEPRICGFCRSKASSAGLSEPG